MALYDVHDIERRLSELHPQFVRIDFDHKSERHRIVMQDKVGAEYIAFTVPWNELDARTERDFIKVTSSRYNAFDEIRESEKAREKAQDAKISDMAHDMADNLLDSFRFKPSRSIA